MVREAVLAGSTEVGSVHVTEAQFTAMLFLDECAPLLQVSIRPQEEEADVVDVKSSHGGGELVQCALFSIDVGEGAGIATSHTSLRTPDNSVLTDMRGRFQFIDGESFYALGGNDHRGDFRSLDTVWLAPGGDNLTMVSKVNSGDAAASLYQVVITVHIGIC